MKFTIVVTDNEIHSALSYLPGVSKEKFFISPTSIIRTPIIRTPIIRTLRLVLMN